ncbi:hypothetical protein L9F63_018296 [Diploptera punctata]|uniref:G-protein coupled receptors family 3 profile domain-containing protein n=1 Tax=Diploptera punctata TaxID=6984 RepID=A0AAD8EFA0_DIPPU|nr:hypothetical protein L9F63_018296 [Diploptera punctata]
MKASLSVLLLVAVRAVLAGTNNRSSIPDDVEPLGSCVPNILEGVVLSPDNMPEAVLELKKVAVEAAEELAQLKGGAPGLDQLSNKLKQHTELSAIAVSMSSSPGYAFVIYRHTDDDIKVHRLSNQSSPVDTTWRTFLDAERNQSSKATSYWSPPFLDCLTGKWLFGYSVSILLGQNRGSGGIFFPVAVHLDINQCNETFSSIFGGGHNCDQDTSECVPAEGVGFRRGYTCVCRPGYFSDSTMKHFRSQEAEHTFPVADNTIHRCIPCPEGCDVCGEDAPCMARYDYLLRTVVLGVQILCMCITLVLAIIVFKQRKCKTIASGMWTILETILLGIFLLYSTVVVRFFDPSVEQCLIEPWCRELGFVICYGAIILKLYRILIEFRTRKAHRWVVRDKDLLKYLLGMVLVVLGYMAAWTATNLNFIQENYSVLTLGTTYDGLQFLACKALWWDYVTETGSSLYSSQLSYACRNATTQFQERRFLFLAIIVEVIVSGAFYILRIIYSKSLHPDYSFLAYFTRSQLTSTVVLLVIFTPKFWYQHKQVTDSRGTRHYQTQEYSCRIPVDAFRPQDGITGTNSKDIRAELKRLYTQLEVLKNKTIRADNPHISKRRGGRKVAHRRFSLQALHHRHQRCSTRHHGGGGGGGKEGGGLDHEVTEGEVSRTPEDSVCSIEGPSAIYNDGPSTYSEVGYGTPNVSYRVSHKQ